MDPDEVRRRVSEGRKHLSFTVSLYRRQLRRGKHFMHEHPQSATSWHEQIVRSLMEDPFTHVVTADQCMYGLETPTKDGLTAPARKSTTFLTSSRQLADLLKTRCDRTHKHQPLVSGRCKDAAFYPLKLVQTILQGIRATKLAEVALLESRRTHREMINAICDAASTIPATPDEAPFESPRSSAASSM